MCDPDYSEDVDKMNVLILNNYLARNYPKMVNFKGEIQDDLFFTQGKEEWKKHLLLYKLRSINWGSIWLFNEISRWILVLRRPRCNL